LEQRKPIFILDKPSKREYSIEKLTQLPQGNKVVEAAASNTDDFLWQDTWVSSTEQNILFGANRAYLHLETPKLHFGFL
jgi:hypothetical protein